MQLALHGNMEYPKKENMSRVSIHMMNLKEKRLEAGKQNIKIIEKKENQTSFL